MKPFKVGVVGYNRIGKRVADGLASQPDLRLGGVYDTDPRQAALVRARGLQLVERDVERWAGTCDTVVVCQEHTPELPVPTVYSPDISAPYPVFGPVGVTPEGNHIRVACADALAFGRLLLGLGPVERLFSSCARRAGHATEHRSASVDALEPLFQLPQEDADLRALLTNLVPEIYVRRTRVPYTHSHLHHLHIDLRSALPRDLLLEGLRRQARIRVAAGAAGFPDTARLQEYDRDLGRPRGDRPEVFVWEETVEVIGRRLYLTIDVSPDAAPILDIMDAVRHQNARRR
jgi:glyceraldehyde-3-phosphate dehydrogenase (NAD(P))